MNICATFQQRSGECGRPSRRQGRNAGAYALVVGGAVCEAVRTPPQDEVRRREYHGRNRYWRSLHVPRLRSPSPIGVAGPGWANAARCSTERDAQAARYRDAEGSTGAIERGLDANLVLLSDDPLKEIGNTESIVGVFLHGKYLPKGEAECDAWTGQGREH